MKINEVAQPMFDLSFYGYSTEDLADLANIPKNDAILIQSGSHKVNTSSLMSMENLVKKLANNHTRG